MRTPMALATLLLAGMASPVSALDVGLGGAGGGVGAGAGLGGGGVSVGAGASMGGGSIGLGGGASLGSGGVTSGAEVSAGGGGAQAGADATLGGTSAGIGVGAGTGSGGGSGGGRSASSGGSTGGLDVGANPSVGPTGDLSGAGRGVGASAGAGGPAATGGVGSSGVADGGRGASGRSGQISSKAGLGPATPFRGAAVLADQAFPLPGRLLPVREAHEPGSPTPRLRPLRPVIPMRTAFRPILSACRAALVEAAVPYGATTVDVAVTGSPRRSSDGGLSAPVEARIVYSRSGRMQVRQARVTCQFDAGGQVVAAL